MVPSGSSCLSYIVRPVSSFDHDKGKTHSSGKLLYSARVIPYRGSWLDFEFDAKDMVYARIDRRRKLPATVLLRALGYDSEEILGMFFDTTAFQLGEDQSATDGLGAQAASGRHGGLRYYGRERSDRGARTSNHGAPHSSAGEAGVEVLEVPEEYLLGRRLAKNVVDTETGELIVECNTEITEELLFSCVKKSIESFETLYTNEIDCGPFISDTLAQDATRNELEALVEIYRMMRPGEPPTKESAENLFQNLFFSADRYDLSAVGRMKFNRRLGSRSVGR